MSQSYFKEDAKMMGTEDDVTLEEDFLERENNREINPHHDLKDKDKQGKARRLMVTRRHWNIFNPRKLPWLALKTRQSPGRPSALLIITVPMFKSWLRSWACPTPEDILHCPYALEVDPQT